MINCPVNTMIIRENMNNLSALDIWLQTSRQYVHLQTHNEYMITEISNLPQEIILYRTWTYPLLIAAFILNRTAEAPYSLPPSQVRRHE